MRGIGAGYAPANGGPAALRVLGERAKYFWLGCALISAGVLLHLPMLAMAHRMGNRLAGMPTDPSMWIGMAGIVIGIPVAIFGALPRRLAPHGAHVHNRYEASDSTLLNRWHAAALGVLLLGLIIDVMKPATLGFVLPGMRAEYGISGSIVAWLPFVALFGTTVGSVFWGWMADRYGRRVSILLSTILFVSTSICGAMPLFQLNLVMCFVMGSSAGGMLPVVYTLVAEIMPPKHRSWVLVLVGGTGLIGGYLAASGAAHSFEPHFGWRVLWLQGFPTGLLLLALAPLIPESPAFLAGRGRARELEKICTRFGIVERKREPPPPADATSAARRHSMLTVALLFTALSWSFVNFGLLLWLPTELETRGYSSSLASAILASSALIALPTVGLAAWLYSRVSTKWTLVGMIAATAAGLAGALLPATLLAWAPLLIGVITLLIVGTNGTIAALLPYCSESYALGIRGRVTGLVAGSSKIGGVGVQGFAIAGLIPTLAGAAAPLLALAAFSGALIAWAGRETRGRSLRELEVAQ